MEVDAYLRRIGLARPRHADLAALRAIHRAHLLSIPYEDLDVQMERPVSTGVLAIFSKIVTRGRGGWCYEMNGLLGWALQELGFRVTRSAGAVMREASGDASIGNHLVLKVELDEGVYLADVGFGDGPLDPVRVEPGPFTSNGFTYALERADGDWWRLHNHPDGGAASFDFNLAEADEAHLSERCRRLQSEPGSSFVQNLVVQQHTSAGLTILRGRVLRHLTPSGRADHLVESADELVTALRREFNLDVPTAATLWPKIVRRHEEVFGAHEPSTIPPSR